MAHTPVAIFDVDPDLLLALEGAFGPPIDSYLMGWQVWLVEVAAEDAPDDLELEYRLHPPAGFTQPAGTPDEPFSHHDLWDEVMVQVGEGRTRLELGAETRDLAAVWTLLEVYPAFGDTVTPAQVRAWAEQALGRPAVASGEVDHERLGGEWKRRGHAVDLPAALRAELGA
ncbi:MAG: hypothetical protein KY461_12975 [Actinobacteria bacterium]|nr:hypothetical protein [Actinomycetota bacterium]